MTTLPRPNQVHILTALRDGESTFTIQDGAIAPGLASKAQIAALIDAGWADPSSGVLTLTAKGESALADAQGRDAYREHSVDHGGTRKVRVSKRTLGRSTIAGRGNLPSGRNVSCWECYEVKRAEYDSGQTRVRPDSVLWFTNESGADAQREAEIVAGKHILRHLAGDL